MKSANEIKEEIADEAIAKIEQEPSAFAKAKLADKLRSCSVAHRTLASEARHPTDQYANNRAELSNQPTRARVRGIRRFNPTKQARRSLENHAAVYNLFSSHRHSMCGMF